MASYIDQQDCPQVAASTARKSGRKRRRAREISVPERRIIRDALRECGDIERISEDFDIAKIEALSDAVVHLLRKEPQTAPSATGRLFVLRRAS